MSFLSWATNLSRRLWAALFPPAMPGPDRFRWSAHLIRVQRYAVLWSFYDQTVYNSYNGEGVRREFNAYKHTRSIYNSCGRIVEFHTTHIQGGHLDPDAGDGKSAPSCLPIIVDDTGDEASIRPAISSILAASNWQSKKSLYVRWGASMGDVSLEVIADVEKELIRLRVVHPAELMWVRKDPYGNVKAYSLKRWETDPTDPLGERIAEYKEVVENENGTVTYKTFKDDTPFAWPGTPGIEWETRFGFVPLVTVQHIDHGGDWGTSEIQLALTKTVERDSQGSNIGDQALKAVNSPWFLTGAKLPEPKAGPNPYASDVGSWPPNLNDFNGSLSKKANLQIEIDDRTGIPIVTCNVTDAKMTPLVFPLPLADADAHAQSIQTALELDYPELRLDSDSVTGDASGKALRELRKKVESKINERRSSYDPPLVHALQMGLTMGGMLGFPDFSAFNADSFKSGQLDFHIGNRPVFAPDPLDSIEEHQARANAVKTYTDASVPLSEALRLTGIEDDQIERIEESRAAESVASLERQKQSQALMFADQGADDGSGSSADNYPLMAS